MSIENKEESEIIFPNQKQSRRDQILAELESIDFSFANEEPVQEKPSDVSMSDFMKVRKPKKQEEEKEINTDAYFNDLMELSDIKINKKRARSFDFASSGYDEKGKKKKKKKKKDKLTNYKKEFEPEMVLLRGLLVDQEKFVESLQKEYNFIKGNKSTSRGVTKSITDLINNITQARSLSMQLVDKHTSLKKTIADLEMKERKEKAGLLGEGDDLSNFASTYLKQMISERQQMLQGNGAAGVSDYSPDEAGMFISDILSNDDETANRESEIDRYLEYENRNVTIYVVMNSKDEEEYEYVARDENGEEIPDYPLPFKGKLTVNRSTNMATDIYGQRYPVDWY